MSGLEAYNSSVFCLQPPGDMESRKGVFDSLMSGCIPVIFNKDMLSINYPWFFPPLNGDHSSNSTLGGMDTANAGIITSHNATSAAAVSHTLADELAVFVSHSMKFDKQFNIVDHLSKIPPEVIRAKQKAIEKFAPTMNYAIPPARFKPFIGHAGGPGVRLPQQKSDFWRPPFRDAVDVILDRMESTVSR